MPWPQVSEGNGASGAIGFFGKVPSIGDFVHRRLPDDFLASWDHWLQRWVLATKTAMGEAWLEHYLVAPFWRFLLVPGVIGPGGWMGVVMPSVDRVGRYFPFTLAVPLPGNVNFVETFLGAHAWFEALEDLGAQALHPQMDLAEWDGRLSVAPMPPLVLGGLEEDATIPLAMGRAGPVALPLPGEDAVSCWRLVSAVAAYRRPFSVFSGIAREQEGRMALAMEGLPDELRCHAFLDGKWSDYGWDTRIGAPAAAPMVEGVAAGQAPAAGAEVAQGAESGTAEAEHAVMAVAAAVSEGAAAVPDADADAARNEDVGVAEPGEADDTLPLLVSREQASEQVGR